MFKKSKVILYPVFLSCFADGAEVVFFMVLRHTFKTHQLLIIYAEELMLQIMDSTEHTLILCWNPASLLLNERLTHIPKGQIVTCRAFYNLSAQWTVLHQLLTPATLDTLLAETVTTGQYHWILKNFNTNRAFKAFFQIIVRRCHDYFFWFLAIPYNSECFLCYRLHFHRNETESFYELYLVCKWLRENQKE